MFLSTVFSYYLNLNHNRYAKQCEIFHGLKLLPIDLDEKINNL